MEELHYVLTISDLHPSIGPLLTRIIEATLQTPEPILDFERSSINSAWLLGSCLKRLSERKLLESSSSMDISVWAETIIQKWAWCGFVLDGLGAFMRARYPFTLFSKYCSDSDENAVLLNDRFLLHRPYYLLYGHRCCLIPGSFASVCFAYSLQTYSNFHLVHSRW